MDANTIAMIRELIDAGTWLAEWEAGEGFGDPRMFNRMSGIWHTRSIADMKALTALLDYYDTNEAKLARMHEVFKDTIAEVEAKREADSRAP